MAAAARAPGRAPRPVPLLQQLLLLLLLSPPPVVSPAAARRSLLPPYFNLAEAARIWATATCGERESGGARPRPELYCKLVGGPTAPGSGHAIQGQFCDYCNSEDPRKAHPASNAIDGSESWWQSPPLSSGTMYNRVNVTLDFGQGLGPHREGLEVRSVPAVPEEESHHVCELSLKMASWQGCEKCSSGPRAAAADSRGGKQAPRSSSCQSCDHPLRASCKRVFSGAQ